MKKELIFLFTSIALIACDSASVNLDDDNYEFDGRGGAKCEVDGVEFIPRVVFSPGANSMDLEFVKYNDKELLNLSYNNRGEENKWLSLRMTINDVNPIENDLTGLVFELNDLNPGTYTDGWMNNFTTNQNYFGEFEIVFHDQNEKILAGRFWFDGINSEGNVREIRNGEFDMKY